MREAVGPLFKFPEAQGCSGKLDGRRSRGPPGLLGNEAVQGRRGKVSARGIPLLSNATPLACG